MNRDSPKNPPSNGIDMVSLGIIGLKWWSCDLHIEHLVVLYTNQSIHYYWDRDDWDSLNIGCENCDFNVIQF